MKVGESCVIPTFLKLVSLLPVSLKNADSAWCALEVVFSFKDVMATQCVAPDTNIYRCSPLRSSGGRLYPPGGTSWCISSSLRRGPSSGMGLYLARSSQSDYCTREGGLLGKYMHHTSRPPFSCHSSFFSAMMRNPNENHFVLGEWDAGG